MSGYLAILLLSLLGLVCAACAAIWVWKMPGSGPMQIELLHQIVQDEKARQEKDER